MTTAPPRPLLALDTSGPTARVALVSADGSALAGGERTSLRHSDSLLPLVHELFGQAGLGVADLGGIACGSGPGSFTGLRVGLAVSKGLALAFDLPLVLVPSLAALALDLARAGVAAPLYAPCLDAGKGEVYVQLFRASPEGPTPLGAELRTTAAAHARERAAGERVVYAGTGADRYAAEITAALGPDAVLAAFPGPSALAVAALARPRFARGDHDDLDAAVPVYGRPPDITTPKRQ